MPTVTFADVSRVFAGGLAAVDRLNLEVADGQLLALLGPSGSGKTTTLRLVAGLERPTAGRILIDGQAVDHLAPRRRNVAISFQHHAIFPHLSVEANLAFGLRVRQGSWPRRMLRRVFRPAAARAEDRAIEHGVRQAAELLGLSEELQRWPQELSGGQQQRVALGRALVRRAAILLLDEPLAHLDGPLRLELRRYLRRWQQQTRATMLYVTHDPAEALALGDRVAVLRQGRLCQVATPETICRRPADRFVAGFLCPTLNFIEGRIVAGESGAASSGSFFCTGFGSLPVDNNTPQAVKQCAGRRLLLAVRPDDARLRPSAESEASLGCWLPARVEAIEREAAARFALLVPRQGAGSTVRVRLADAARMQAGEPVDVGIDLSRAMWFESDSGRAVIE